MTTITQSDQWLGVEVRHFAALDAVAREGSFGRAADRLGYTQSAVSQQIATLERIVGETLVERPGGPRAVSLTEAGVLLLRHAEAIVARLDAARADIAALRAGETGTLRVGTYQSVGARVLPGVMRRFLADWPGIELGLSEPATDPDLYDLDRVGRGRPRVLQPTLARRTLRGARADERPVRARSCLPTARSRDRKSASLDDLDDQVLIGANTCSSGFVVENELRERGYGLDYAFRSDDNGTLQGLVAAGFGVALLPLLAVAAPGDERIRVIRLRPEDAAAGDRGRLAPRPAPFAGRPRLHRHRARGQRRGRARPRRAVAQAQPPAAAAHSAQPALSSNPPRGTPGALMPR